jgi:hypothetical protein
LSADSSDGIGFLDSADKPRNVGLLKRTEQLKTDLIILLLQ